MKRIVPFMLMIALSGACSIPAQAEDTRATAENMRRARRGAKDQQKMLKKAAKNQRKAMKKYEKAQRKHSKANYRTR
jgi:hypothetical protein